MGSVIGLVIDSEIGKIIESEIGKKIGFDLATFHAKLYLAYKITKHSLQV